LLKEGKAYRCFCAKEQLHEFDKSGSHIPAEQRASNPCIHISPEESEERASKGETHAVIFKASATPVKVKDMVYREFRNAKPEFEFVIRKQDGFPTYHLANVVDDHLMKITHVIRGAEWLISTPRHVDLYNAFGWEPPRFAHVGLLVDAERQKLSKRHQGVTMDWYKERKIAPDALLNFAALLGWAPRDRTDSEFMTLEDMVRKFHLKFTKGDIMVTMPKLDFLREKHGVHLVEQEPRDDAKVREYVTRPLIKAINKFTSHGESATRENFGLEPDEPLPNMTALAAAAFNPHTGIINDDMYFFKAMRFTKVVAWEPKLFLSDYKWLLWQVPEEVLVRTWREISKTYKGLTIYKTSYDPVGVLEFIQHRLENMHPEAWTIEDLKAVIKRLDKHVERNIEDKGKGNKDNIYTPLQWALIAGHNGPAVWEQMVFLGRAETTRRIKLATEVARKMALETPNPDEAKETEVTESKNEVKVTTEEVKETEETPKKTEAGVKEN
jgi:glutamyl-tRNA synthetase